LTGLVVYMPKFPSLNCRTILLLAATFNAAGVNSRSPTVKFSSRPPPRSGVGQEITRGQRGGPGNRTVDFDLGDVPLGTVKKTPQFVRATLSRNARIKETTDFKERLVKLRVFTTKGDFGP
jgi:hypothetical protein